MEKQREIIQIYNSLSEDDKKVLEARLKSKGIDIKQEINKMERQEEHKFPPIKKVEKREYYPMASAQKRVYTVSQFENIAISYNMPTVMLIEGIIDLEKLNEAFKEIINRHESLRTSFEIRDGEPVQIIHETVNFNIDYVELKENYKEEIAINEFIVPFNLKEAPLIRIRLIKKNNVKYIMVVDVHHIVADGMSMNILFKELVDIYDGNKLEKLNIQYKDYAIWQNQLSDNKLLKKEEKYWTERFSKKVPVQNFPLDYSRPPIQSFEGKSINFVIDNIITDKLKRLAKDTNTTLYMVLLAAYTVLLYKYTGQNDITIGSPSAGRFNESLKNVVGMFVNTIVMRNYPVDEIVFKDFLNEVKKNSLEAFENQDYQFEDLINKVISKRDMSRNPLFDTMFVLQNIDSEIQKAKTFSLKQYKDVTFNVAKFDITVTALEKEGGIEFLIEYCSKLFKKDSMERFANHLKNVIKNIVNNPNEQIKNINILQYEEINDILYTFNNTKKNYPTDKTVKELFEEQVERKPNNIAVVYKNEVLTYRELNERSNQLAVTLREEGISTEDVVAIITMPSIEMIVAILAVLKAGATYLPIDCKYPEERIEYILKDSNVDILLTQHNLVDNVKFDGSIIDLNDSKIYERSKLNLDTISKKNNLAYII